MQVETITRYFFNFVKAGTEKVLSWLRDEYSRRVEGNVPLSLVGAFSRRSWFRFSARARRSAMMSAALLLGAQASIVDSELLATSCRIASTRTTVFPVPGLEIEKSVTVYEL